MTRAADLSDRELTERLGHSLRAKARTVSPTAYPRPFDPTAPRMPGLVPVLTDAALPGGPRGSAVLSPPPVARRRRPPMWPMPVAAAVLVLVVGCAAFVLAARDGEQVRVGPTRTTASSDPTTTTAAPAEAPSVATPDGALLPQWLPDGMIPADGFWNRRPGILDFPRQLFGGGGEAALYAELQPSSPGGSSFGDPVTVRGVAGVVGPSKEGGNTTISWYENGAGIDATYTGMSSTAAIAFLDTLTWRGTDFAAGFSPPSGGSLGLVAESVGTKPPSVMASYIYRDAAGRSLSVMTNSPAGGASLRYMELWLAGARRPDGTVAVTDPDGGHLEQHWPDGHEIMVDGTGLSGSELRHVFDSVAPSTGEVLDTLDAAISSHLVNAPLVAQADLPSATVERHGEAGAGEAHAVCLRPSGSDVVCPEFSYPDLWWDHTDAMVANVAINGTWYLAVVSSQPMAIQGGGPLDLVDLPAEQAFDGTWHFALALPDPALSQVYVSQGGNSVGLPRPEGVDTG